MARKQLAAPQARHNLAQRVSAGETGPPTPLIPSGVCGARNLLFGFCVAWPLERRVFRPRSFTPATPKFSSRTSEYQNAKIAEITREASGVEP